MTTRASLPHRRCGRQRLLPPDGNWSRPVRPSPARVRTGRRGTQRSGPGRSETTSHSGLALLAKRGSRPAKTSDDLPLPDGPTTATKGYSRACATRSWIAWSRPQRMERPPLGMAQDPCMGRWRHEYRMARPSPPNGSAKGRETVRLLDDGRAFAEVHPSYKPSEIRSAVTRKPGMSTGITGSPGSCDWRAKASSRSYCCVFPIPCFPTRMMMACERSMASSSAGSS